MKKIAQLLLATSFIFGLAACAESNARTAGILELEGDAARGSTIFENNCLACHGADLQGTDNGPDILHAGTDHDDTQNMDVILNGGLFGMPSFEDQLDDQEAADLLSYLNTQW